MQTSQYQSALHFPVESLVDEAAFYDALHQHEHEQGPFVRLAASTVVIKDDQLLMVRQGKGRKRGLWNLPGGKVEADESPMQAAIRETHEETGYVVALDGVHGIQRYINRSGKLTARCLFRATVEDGQPECDGFEIMDVRWLGVKQVKKWPSEKLCRPQLLRRVLKQVAI